MSYYIFSDDRCEHCPDVHDVPADAPVTVIAVANYASFHMLSYLLDEIEPERIDQIFFVDTNEHQLEHHKRVVQAILDSPDDRLHIIENILGVRFANRFHVDSDRMQTESPWTDCDTGGFEDATGRQIIAIGAEGLVASGNVPDLCESPIRLGMYYPGPKHKFAGLIEHWAGLDYGFLRDSERLRANMELLRDKSRYIHGTIECVCDEWQDYEEPDGHTFVWLSNIMTNRTCKASKRRLEPLRELPRWHLWQHVPSTS